MTLAELSQLFLSPWVLGLFGLCIGSFLNVVIYRLPVMLEREWWQFSGEYQLGDPAAWRRAFGGEPPPSMAQASADVAAAVAAQPKLSLSQPRSRCGACGHVLRWHENIPLLGWLRLRGRCSACGTHISLRYPIVEAATGLLFFASAMAFGSQPSTLVWCLAIALMIAMALIDADTTLLPDTLTLPLIGLGVVASAAGWTSVPLSDSAIGAVAGYASLWSVSFLYKLTRGVEGMAEGDFKLLAGIGALMGWKILLPVILLASLVGAVVGIGLILFRNHKREVPIPFGPYLVGGGLLAMFFGPQLLEVMLPGLAP
jgi:leader peptidase (prepilin peptidase)/N-methyltransferase